MSKPPPPPPRDPAPPAGVPPVGPAAEAASLPPAAPVEELPPPSPTPLEVERWRARAGEADGLEDRLKRSQAEFVNESKRIARQAEQDRRFAVEQVVKDLVPLAEGLDSALAAAGASASAATLKDGVALVAQQLEEILKRHGVELIRPAGAPFDPLSHEAILVVERADVPPNHVADVVRPGFRLHGRVVRPAQVTVAKAAAPGAPEAR